MTCGDVKSFATLCLPQVSSAEIFVIPKSCSIKPQQLAASSSYAIAKPKSDDDAGHIFLNP